MSMVWVARLADDSQTAAVMARPSFAYDFINPEGEVDRAEIIDLDKEWHAVHHLLTGFGGATDSPLSLIIGTFETIGDDNGYGPAWYIPADALQEFSEAVMALDEAKLRKCYDPDAMVEENVYIGEMYQEEGEEGLGFLLRHIDNLRQFASRGAAAGCGAFAVIT